MRKSTLEAIKAHAAAEMPREACGFVVATGPKKVGTVKARNIAGDPRTHFRIAPEDFLAAEKLGTITHVYHTHPNGRAIPSDADRAACQAVDIPFLIVAFPVDEHVVIKPDGWVAPLYGREFVHGVHDCYAFVRDYYKQECKIELAEFYRQDLWWTKGEDLYAKNFAEQGFVEIGRDPLLARKNDALLMRVLADVENHAAIFIGEQRIAHHVFGSARLSCREFYAPFWKDCTTRVLRHKSLL